jgi:hypothetical protein
MTADRAMTVLGLAFLAFVSLAVPAQAELWSTPGGGCVPTESTTKFDRHKVGIGSIQHAPTNVDLITLLCPVAPFTNANTNWNLFINYQDSTGTSPSAFIRARLYRMSFQSNIPVLMATVNSNSSPVTTPQFLSSPMFTHTFQSDANVYWVRVDIDRSSTSEKVVLHSVVILPFE